MKEFIGSIIVSVLAAIDTVILLIKHRFDLDAAEQDIDEQLHREKMKFWRNGGKL